MRDDRDVSECRQVEEGVGFSPESSNGTVRLYSSPASLFAGADVFHAPVTYDISTRSRARTASCIGTKVDVIDR